MAIEIVDLPIDSMVIFHSYVTVYQRVSWEQLLSLFHDILEYDWNITGHIDGIMEYEISIEISITSPSCCCCRHTPDAPR